MQNIFTDIERTIRKPFEEYEKKIELLNSLLEMEKCGVMIIGKDYRKKYSAKIPKGNMSIERITYILRKWYRQQFDGGGITEYILGEEIKDYSFKEKITHIR